MSLVELRARWLKTTRSGVPEESAEHFVIAATLTADPLVPYLGGKYIEDGSRTPRITVAPYDQIFQVCLDWQAMFTARAPTAIILIWRIEDMLRPELQGFLRGNPDALQRALDKTEELRAAILSLRRSFTGAIVVSIPPFASGPDHDIRAARTAVTAALFHRRIIDRWVAGIDDIGGVSFLDLDSIQRLVGIERSYDPRKWYLYRQPFTEQFWHDAADDLCRTLKRQRTAAKKCLVVDCDNTLWGGIIGEDGLEGIALGEDFPGSAFRDFQQQLLTLRSQGVMLAICSKNNESDVWEVFERHDGMVLKREHFVAHRINWQDKAANIEQIAEELNIGLDSLVFVDDSPTEIAFVSNNLPMVTCIQVPNDVARFPLSFNSFRLFDRERISEEDGVRSDMMLQERGRKALGASLTSEEFARALELSVDFFDVQAEHVTRVTQLINKTNQFNLTTRRRTAGEVSNLCETAGVKIFAWRVADRFGDYGLVGVVILQRAGDSIDIDTFLMSCRVLGRGVEDAVFAAIADYAALQNATKLRGQYVPTNKNSLVADLYRDHGFRPVGDGYWESDDLGGLSWPAHIARVGL
ncbi:MAG: HAD-IIIC family phosphatase [Steroidobacteraceae bacterium]